MPFGDFLAEVRCMKNDVHIGKLIKQRLSESGLSISDFATAIHKTRTNVYDIFKRKNVDIDLLISISEILHFDFISYLHEAQMDTPPFSKDSNKYLIVKIVEESELKKEDSVLFSYKLNL